jgi:Ni/Fe-hydrogenase subunit HybB-like protein
MMLNKNTKYNIEESKIISNKVLAILNDCLSRKYYYLLIFLLTPISLGVYAAYITFSDGIAAFGLNNSVIWGLSIASFVFWIGIGHAGTLISAILYLFNQKWRSPIHRMAETMTIISVIMASIFLIIHTGRPWLAAYWLFPYPSQMGMWVNFSSPLIWDLFAILSYFILSVMYWYYGMIPDFAFYKNKVNSKILKVVYDWAGLGFYGSEKQWYYYQRSYMIFAGLATAMVISVHTIVSFDFSVTIVPGWHLTIYPLYFVAGAIFSGIAFVIKLIIINRYVFKLEQYITKIHIEKLNKIFLAMSLIITYSYIMEFVAGIFGDNIEKELLIERTTGKYSLLFWFTVFTNSILPLLYINKKLRKSIIFSFIISLFVNIGMWLERFVIVVVSLYKDILPSDDALYFPSYIEWFLLVGSFGLFTLLYLIFIRLFPIMSVSELKMDQDNEK